MGRREGVLQPHARKRHTEAGEGATEVDPTSARRVIVCRQTVRLDEDRHRALNRIADASGRSVHALILEGIDRVIGAPPAG